MSDLSPMGQALAEDVYLILRLVGLPRYTTGCSSGFDAHLDHDAVRVIWRMNECAKTALGAMTSRIQNGSQSIDALERHVVVSMHRTIAEILLEFGYTLMVLEPPLEEQTSPSVSVIDGPNVAEAIRAAIPCEISSLSQDDGEPA
ncbi:hypothetical protein Ssi03_59140 [Sphaerisporangium siamense]|uniref:Uncharacterized protein n=1 Tax=Sphaerisporangium siamense TaxID=795645 RepID=A0A7W7G809_9ACTN|nr:hypothetical protein [Sphaerisporangium siamense]MBB4699742.1 hypothetical protein [Sphaerisporangium siamense]GII87924.1 hypothetical protein Ssi03_59140 [Sphaerisporangium siamense]